MLCCDHFLALTEELSLSPMIPVNSLLQRSPVVTTEASYSSKICTTTNTIHLERGTFTVATTGKFLLSF